MEWDLRRVGVQFACAASLVLSRMLGLLHFAGLAMF